MENNNKPRFFYGLCSDKPWVFRQSERALGPFYITNKYIHLRTSSDARNSENRSFFSLLSQIK